MPSTTNSLTDFFAEMQQGASFIRNYQWLESDVPVDITGATFVATATRDYGAAALFTFTTNITDAVNGKFDLQLTAAVTGAQTPVLLFANADVPVGGRERQYELLAYDILITLAGTTTPLVYGTIKFYPTA